MKLNEVKKIEHPKSKASNVQTPVGVIVKDTPVVKAKETVSKAIENLEDALASYVL